MGVGVQTVKRLEKGVGSVPILIAAMGALDLRFSGVGPGMTLPEQLRGRRVRRSLSLTGVASQARLSRATVAGVEQGRGSVASLLSVLAVLAPGARRRSPERS